MVLHDIIELDGVGVAVRAYKQQGNKIADVIDGDETVMVSIITRLREVEAKQC